MAGALTEDNFPEKWAQYKHLFRLEDLAMSCVCCKMQGPDLAAEYADMRNCLSEVFGYQGAALDALLAETESKMKQQRQQS